MHLDLSILSQVEISIKHHKSGLGIAKMVRNVYPSDLTDPEWELIESLLPAESEIGHPRKVDLREVINAIFYVHREGCPWRGLPGDFPPWQTVYNYLRHWQRCGVWQQIHDQLRQPRHQAVEKHVAASTAMIESQSIKTMEERASSIV